MHNATCLQSRSTIEKNTPPVANAGGDQSITLPVSAIYLNGTKSSDDLGVVRYTWTRDGGSLAIGNIVGNTSSEAVLIVSIFLRKLNPKC